MVELCNPVDCELSPAVVVSGTIHFSSSSLAEEQPDFKRYLFGSLHSLCMSSSVKALDLVQSVCDDKLLHKNGYCNSI